LYCIGVLVFAMALCAATVYAQRDNPNGIASCWAVS